MRLTGPNGRISKQNLLFCNLLGQNAIPFPPFCLLGWLQVCNLLPLGFVLKFCSSCCNPISLVHKVTSLANAKGTAGAFCVLCGLRQPFVVLVELSLSTGAAESPSSTAGDSKDQLAPDERWGPLPHNKTLFLGYAFLLTMANPTDKLASHQKSAVSSEEEEGERL